MITNCFFNEKWTIFIALFFLLVSTCIAQQPGGVMGTKLWYITEKAGPNSFLKDKSGYNRHSIQGDNSLLDINFHPALSNPVWNQSKRLFQNFAFNQVTVVGIYFPEAVSNGIFLGTGYKEDNLSKDSLVVRRGQVDTLDKRTNQLRRKTTFNPELVQPPQSFNQNKAMRIATLFKASSKQYNSIWAEEKTTTINTAFNGYLPELIVYNRVLSPLERCKVETYFAIKYGITLDTSLVVGSGNTIWNVNDPTLKLFHNRICVIGKDSKSAIWQPASNSTYEEGYSAYKYDAHDSKLYAPSYEFIPKIDSPSLYRSVTIGFSDKSLQSVQESSFFILGDDSAKVELRATGDTTYKGLETVGRKWLLNNPGRLNYPLRVMIAGKSYKASQTVFEKLYQPYDYQFFRYVLVFFKPDNMDKIDKIVLNSYFGREQPKAIRDVSFNTRTLVWDSIICNNASPLNFFTFGRVPLLSFWDVGKTADPDNKQSKLRYQYFRQLPLNTEVNSDTTIYQFKSGDILRFSLTSGVNKVSIRYKGLNDNQWRTLGVDEPSTIDSLTLETSVPGGATDEEEISTGEISTDNSRYIDKKNWHWKSELKKLTKAVYQIPNLRTNNTYIIEAEDAIGQKASLRIKLVQSPSN